MSFTIKKDVVDGEEIEVKVYKEQDSLEKKPGKFKFYIEKEGMWWKVLSNRGGSYGRFSSLKKAKKFIKKKYKMMEQDKNKVKLYYGYNTSKG